MITTIMVLDIYIVNVEIIKTKIELYILIINLSKYIT